MAREMHGRVKIRQRGFTFVRIELYLLKITIIPLRYVPRIFSNLNFQRIPLNSP